MDKQSNKELVLVEWSPCGHQVKKHYTEIAGEDGKPDCPYCEINRLTQENKGLKVGTNMLKHSLRQSEARLFALKNKQC